MSYFIIMSSIFLCYVTVALLSVIGFSFANLFDTIKYYTISNFYEQCDSRWAPVNFEDLEKELDHSVFGQDLALDIIITALQSRSRKNDHKKPLVLNFHGWPGGGKSYVADIILKHWYREGKQSNFVRLYQAQLHFPERSKAGEYQKRLQNELEETISRCPKALFVFDEVDKFPPHVLDGIKPYLDYNSFVNGHDFRQAIFIFITNTGEKLITKIVREKQLQGIPREDLTLRDFQQALKLISFNEDGGFFQSDLIKHHLIDYLIPFLPLEREHVIRCIKEEFVRQNMGSILNNDYISLILNEIEFEAEGVYSTHGCKHISEKVSFFKENAGRQRRKAKEHTEL